jgi:hypothetical protein
MPHILFAMTTHGLHSLRQRFRCSRKLRYELCLRPKALKLCSGDLPGDLIVLDMHMPTHNGVGLYTGTSYEDLKHD